MQNVNSISKLFAYKIYLNMQKATAEAVTFPVFIADSGRYPLSIFAEAQQVYIAISREHCDCKVANLINFTLIVKNNSTLHF